MKDIYRISSSFGGCVPHGLLKLSSQLTQELRVSSEKKTEHDFDILHHVAERYTANLIPFGWYQSMALGRQGEVIQQQYLYIVYNYLFFCFF